MIVSCDSSGLVMTWDLRARKVVNKIDCGPSNANMVCFDPTGLLVVVATGDNLVKVVELSNEKVIFYLLLSSPYHVLDDNAYHHSIISKK